MSVRTTISTMSMVLLGAVLSLAVLAQAPSPEKKAKPTAKESRVSGMVQSIDKGASTITVRKGTTDRFVVYNDQTQFTFQNKLSSLQEVKERRKVVCLGKFDDRNRLVATRIEVKRETP